VSVLLIPSVAPSPLYVPALQTKPPSDTYVAYAKEYSREDLQFPYCPIVDLSVPSQQQ
jgi:hypothetical protein